MVPRSQSDLREAAQPRCLAKWAAPRLVRWRRAQEKAWRTVLAKSVPIETVQAKMAPVVLAEIQVQQAHFRSVAGLQELEDPRCPRQLQEGG
mmetsp:Transcript_20044/g.43742  ORF Transcript_20044/g.43742 Transcript_20044/m.43742 type:complete len:92 (-) Transcript_20044:752-1027(-)